MPQDTALARSVINTFNNAQLVAERVRLYQTTEPISADVRYTLTHKPYIAVYDDGGNQNIHTNGNVRSVLRGAGIGNNRYQVLSSGTPIDTLSCFTFASEPHWDKTNYVANDSLRIRNLDFFLRTGGNFLAQCVALRTFENFPEYYFLTTNGVNTYNAAANAANVQYANNDMPVMQLHGLYLNDGGSVNSFIPSIGSNWQSSSYKGIFFMQNVIGDAALDSVLHVAVRKVIPNDHVGGNLIYLSGHNYDGTSIDQVNGRRVYLNAVFMPVLRTLPMGSAYANSPVLCQGDTLKLFLNPPAGSGYTYLWTGPNGFTSTQQNPVIPNFDASKAGLYRVTLTTTQGCRFTYPAFTIAMYDAIGDINAISTIAGCVTSEGGQCVLDVTEPLTGTGTWSIVSGPGSITNPASTLTTVTGLSDSGIPTIVKWLVTTSQGCRDSVVVNINPPVIDSTYVSRYDNEYCLQCPVKNGGSYVFIDPDGKILSMISNLDENIAIGETEFCARLTYALPGNPTAFDVPTTNFTMAPSHT